MCRMGRTDRQTVKHTDKECDTSSCSDFNKFEKVAGIKVTSGLMASYQVVASTACAIRCQTTGDCQGFNFGPSGVCHLVMDHVDQGATTASGQGLDHYKGIN